MNQLNKKIISIAIFIAIIVFEITITIACRDTAGFNTCLGKCPVKDIGGECFRKCLNYC